LRSLEGKVAIVTGAASGIGRATATRFAADGARVACFDIDTRGLEETRSLAGDAGGEALPVQADVTDAGQVARGIDAVLREYGQVDVLVNVAGQNFEGDVGSLSPAAWNACIALNLTSVYLTAHGLWSHFRERRTGLILNTASVMGRVGARNAVAYCSAKAAVIHLTRCLAADGAEHGIRANCVCPGFVDSPIMDSEFAKAQDARRARVELEARLPLGRMASLDELAGCFAYLASPDAAYMTGAVLDVDGGLTSNLSGRY
jgi:NAD(P)-dependent dehydrogenase (short-subunit alcohol dehydrogenase family)